MKTAIYYFLIAIIFSSPVFSQVSEDFSDGNFTSNPTWIGDTSSWIINASQQLQSNSTVANSSFYLSTQSTKALNAQWEFSVQMQFNPSSANYIDIYLTASLSDITQSSNVGYFVRIGNTDDEISLYRKDNGAIIKLIDGINGVLNTTNNTIDIKVIRNNLNQWELTRDLNMTGNFMEGTAVDSVYTTSAFVGLLIKQSTASFFKKHFFNKIIVQEYVPDIIPPTIQAINITGPNTIEVIFNEAVEQSSSELTDNYVVNNNVNTPTYIIRDAINHAMVYITFASAFPVRTQLEITISGVADVMGNKMTNAINHFFIYTSLPFDVLIDEIMADPSPVVGLPDEEWIELRNNTLFPINLKGWKICKSNTQSGALPDFILQPDSMIVVCSTGALSNLSLFGTAISVTNFPSLSNVEDEIYLLSSEGKSIHAIHYTDSWYKNEMKKNGGWSLEMIDLNNPCTGFDNWIASKSLIGGTPGKINSEDAVNIDITSPALIRAFATDSLHVTLYFNEPLDSLQASDVHFYNMSDGIGDPISVFPVAPIFDKINIVLQNPLLRNKTYTLSVNGVTDCIANPIGINNKVFVGLSEPTDSLDVVVNEILFNPTSDGVDYVELFNRSNKILNLKNISIANLNTLGVIDNITTIKKDNHAWFPKEYAVVTSDGFILQRDYVVNNPTAIVNVDNMPSYNDDEGTVILLNEQGLTLDKLTYNDSWHFKLLNNKEGVALERIDCNATTQNEQNWQSAASDVGYGTPSYQNSQSNIIATSNNEILVLPKTFSPDNDGQDDYTMIEYQFNQPGYVANITIYDPVGRPVRYLEKSVLCGMKGFFKWDGLNESNQQIGMGIYIIYTEVFNLKGESKKYKNVVVLARRQ